MVKEIFASVFSFILKEVEVDKGQPPRVASKYYYTNFTKAQEMFIAKAEDINNSDIDFVDTVDGDVYISYSWSNQEGTEFFGKCDGERYDVGGVVCEFV